MVRGDLPAESDEPKVIKRSHATPGFCGFGKGLRVSEECPNPGADPIRERRQRQDRQLLRGKLEPYLVAGHLGITNRGPQSLRFVIRLQSSQEDRLHAATSRPFS